MNTVSGNPFKKLSNRSRKSFLYLVGAGLPTVRISLSSKSNKETEETSLKKCPLFLYIMQTC